MILVVKRLAEAEIYGIIWEYGRLFPEIPGLKNLTVVFIKWILY